MIDLKTGITQYIDAKHIDDAITGISFHQYCDTQYCKYLVNNKCTASNDDLDSCYVALYKYLEAQGYLDVEAIEN